MSTSLEVVIAKLAQDFAQNLLRAVRGASLADVAAMSGGRGVQPRGKKVRTPRLGWPKCPVCGKNAYPRGKGYCFEHSEAGKAKAKAAGKAAKPGRKRPARKAA